MWTSEHIVNVDNLPSGARKWWLMSLAMLINRHCPDYFDDDLIESELHRVWAEQKDQIPFAIWEV